MHFIHLMQVGACVGNAGNEGSVGIQRETTVVTEMQEMSEMHVMGIYMEICLEEVAVSCSARNACSAIWSVCI